MTQREATRGSYKAYSREQALAAFFDKTIPEPNTGCLLWTGTIHERGYGLYRRNYRPLFAHRWIYEQLRGPIADGLFACHRCDTPLCVNVDHLFLGTPKDNVHDALRKGRVRNGREKRTHCPSGHEYTPDNTYDNRGRRHCRACKQQRDRVRIRVLASAIVAKQSEKSND